MKFIQIIYIMKRVFIRIEDKRRNRRKWGFHLAIIITMLVLGMLLGFVGAGGAGFIIAILTLMFHIPIHTALGTSLAAMAFTCLSGVVSHYRGGNIAVTAGIVVGAFGAIGAFFGSMVAAIIPTAQLHWFTGGMLIFSSILFVFRLFLLKQPSAVQEASAASENNYGFWIRAIILGLLSGLMSGSFGIGAAPFIQLGLMIFLGLSVRHSVGTAMLVILPIAIGGGLGFGTSGFVDVILLIQILVGSMTGAYIGAKFTNLAPKSVLKISMISTPAAAGLLLILG